MTDHIVVGDRVAVAVGFGAGRARLRNLAAGKLLPQACEVAYGEGITTLVKLAGPDAGLTRLADVCLADMTEGDDCVHIALRWEAIAADGKLFTALLADLMLVPAGDQITMLSLAGACWPPPGRDGVRASRAIERCCAMAIASSLLDSTACGLAHPAGTAGDSISAHRPRG